MLAAPEAPVSLVIQMPRPLPGPAEPESTFQTDLQTAHTYSARDQEVGSCLALL